MGNANGFTIFTAVCATAATIAIGAGVAAAKPSSEQSGVSPAKGAEAFRGANIPKNFRRHQNRYWVWFGPKGWIDSYGANDLTVSSPIGRDRLHFGISSVYPCVEPAQWFAFIRRNARASGDLYSKRLRTSRYTRVGAVRQVNIPGIPFSWKQDNAWTGKRPNGQRIRGDLTIRFYWDGVETCAQDFSVRGTPGKGFAKSIRVLRKVQKLIFLR